MRPEKHQKIRRHQKNKHGKGGHGSSSSSKQKSADSTGKNSTKSQPSKHPPERSQLPRPNNSDDLHSSSNETRTTASASNDSQEERRSFSRRKIESNWSRYGDIENLDDENVNQRGADLSLLLSKEDDSSSQFRFKDELDWQDDVYLQEEDATNVLSLNVESLASQIQCLPISQRLNIDEKIFSMFEEDFGIGKISNSRGILQNAETKNDKDSESLKPSGPVEDVAKTVPDNIKLNIDSSTKEQLKSAFKPYLQTEKKSTTGSTEINFKNQKASKQLDPAKTSLNRTNPVHNFIQTSNVKEQEKTDDDNDDELDFLLALGNPTKTKQLSNRKQCIDDQEIKTELDVQKETHLTTSNTKKTDQESNEKRDEGNLEDWLDSILDD